MNPMSIPADHVRRLERLIRNRSGIVRTHKTVGFRSTALPSHFMPPRKCAPLFSFFVCIGRRGIGLFRPGAALSALRGAVC